MNCDLCKYYAALRGQIIEDRQVLTGVCILRCIADQSCVNPTRCHDYTEKRNER